MGDIPAHVLDVLRAEILGIPVTARRALTTKGLDVRCAMRGTTWPCEVGQALAIVEALLIRP